MDEISLVDPAWETIDPNPNIWSLFAEFDKRFFNGKLTSSCVELMWSSNRMTSTAGLCCWNPRTNYACIKLSQPLLQLRPRSDLVETLLHEMIHAFLFVTRQDDNHESHGPKFHMHMFRINKETGTNITVYHTFHDEVKHYQQHVWRCDGPCALRPPYYGYVRRANNRKPGSYDFWWATHQANCSGTFNKISEPEKVVKPKQNPKSKSVSVVSKNKRIDDFFKTSPPSTSKMHPPPFSTSNVTQTPSKKTPVKPSPIKHGDIRNYISPIKSEPTFPGQGYRLGSSIDLNPVKRLKLEPTDTNEVPKSAIVESTVSKQPLPDLVSGIDKTSDEEDSFTYDLPEFDLDDSIIVETIIPGKSSQSNQSTNPVQHNPIASQAIKNVQDKDEDEEDPFTYELPNFIPFLGTGFKLGSTKPQLLARGDTRKPQIIKLD